MITKTSKDLVLAIKSRMKVLNISVFDLAIKSNLNISTLECILDYKYTPSLEVFERIGNVLGLRLFFISNISDNG